LVRPGPRREQALNVVRRTAAYPWRLRLSDGGTLTARSVVITTGVT
jgi:hypothetical protein